MRERRPAVSDHPSAGGTAPASALNAGPRAAPPRPAAPQPPPPRAAAIRWQSGRRRDPATV